MTKHVRNRLKVAGIKASVTMSKSCGVQWIKVDPISYGIEFTKEEQSKIVLIAKVNGLTLSRGMEIIDNGTGANGFNFVLPA